ncbi:MAG: VanW family protein [Myxococcota bacterium]|nr:VanW family protein [Myxococcota bacterium]
MSQTSSPRSKQHGAVLLGLAGGMLIVAGGLVGGYYVVGTRSVARAATAPSPVSEARTPDVARAPAKTITDVLGREVVLETAGGPIKLSWAELGVELDPEESKRISANADVVALAKTGSLPLRLDREKAVKALMALKAKTDRAPINAYLDLEARKVQDDSDGKGLDVWGSLPRLAAAARQNAPTLQLATIDMPALVTKEGLGIEDISHVLGHYLTKFSVADKDRNFNLKLAASKLNGVVLKPNEEFSFNGTVGERSQRMGYKVAHVITSGEMVDGLAGGTCQISTTLFGAAFFAGIDIVKTINHSRPSAYTPLGFDATVVWPDVDLKLKNTYDFPVVIRYVVANGESKVEILGKKRPFDKVVFEREVLEESPFSSEERLDAEMPMSQTSIDQEGFPGFKLERFRKFYKGNKLVKTNKWLLTYKPVTEYIRRGTNPDPAAKMPEVKPHHGPKAPKNEKFSMAQ